MKRSHAKSRGRSGLGLGAQDAAIREFAREHQARIIGEYLEVESGRNDERPQLAAALHHAKVKGATLVIAKLDRLSRSASFTLALRDAGLKFVCCDMPVANDLTIGVLAVVAQDEAERISQRTKDALAMARKRLVVNGQKTHRKVKRLGNPNGTAALKRADKGNAAAIATVQSRADQRARDLAPIITDIRACGAVSLEAIAAELNAREMMTARGGRWHAYPWRT